MIIYLSFFSLYYMKFKLQKKTFFSWWSVEDESHSLRKDAALWSGGLPADTSVSLATQQQVEQAVAGAGIF